MKFSVVIPIYKVEPFLRECVDNVLAQTYKNIDVILVDDGSPDGCPAICDEYAGKDERVKVIHKINGGLSDARNAGLEMATGDYVIFLDSDDYWISGTFLEEMQSIIQKENCDVIFFDRVSFEDGGTIPYQKKSKLSTINGMTKSQAVDWMVRNDCFIMCAWGKVVKKSLLTDNHISFEVGRLSEDFDWTSQLMLVAKKLVGYDKRIYAYRRRAGSITKTFNPKHFDDLLTVLERWANRLTSVNTIDIVMRKAMLTYCCYQYCILLGRWRTLKLSDKLSFEERLKVLTFLFDYDISPKVKAAAKLYKMGGVLVVSKVLSLYLKITKK